MNGFRLLAVRTSNEAFQAPWINGHLGAEGRSIDVVPAEVARPSLETWVSVIIGRNGLGKSRTLGGVAAVFEGVGSGRGRIRSRSGTQWRVRYLHGTDECELWTTPSGEIRAQLNYEPRPVHSLPLPSKVIALSTTATDKFPLPPQKKGHDDAIEEDLYSYMGLRDRTGRASATAVAYRALEALVEATEATHERRVRIAEVFNFLGYAPRVEHTYRWRYGSLLRNSGDLTELLDREPGSSTYPNAMRLRQMVERDPTIRDQLQKIVTRLIDATSPERELRLSADFLNTGSEELARFRDTQLLKRAGLVTLDGVELEHSESGLKVDLREVSSGELSIATTFLGLAAVIEDDALVMIDEPEVSLHPEWQTQYLELLTGIFSKFRGCHFVVATHSPLVVSGVPSQSANVISLDFHSENSTAGGEYAGDSIDEVLVRAFDVAGKNNLFVKQLLVEALRLAADGELSSPEFSDALSPLVRLAPSLEPKSPTRDLIEQLMRAHQGSQS